MAIGDVQFVGEKDPLKKVQQTYSSISESDIEAVFLNPKKKKELTRAYIEMVIEDFALLTQNQSLYNKFLQVDTKLEKSLREYQAEIKGLLNSIVGLSVPQQQANQPVSVPTEPQAQPINMPQPNLVSPSSVGVE